MRQSKDVAVTSSDHNRLIHAAAKVELAPLGLQRKGRSRTWLDDQDWWLGVVEFQPSGWDRGTYLNVGLMLLWRPAGQIRFDIGYRKDGFTAADASFESTVQAKAALAATEVVKQRSNFRTPAAVIKHYSRYDRKGPVALGDMAIAHAKLGHARRAQRLFDQAAERREELMPSAWHSTAWIAEARAVASDLEALIQWMGDTTSATRAALGLPRTQH